jgi:hypothetical protein
MSFKKIRNTVVDTVRRHSPSNSNSGPASQPHISPALLQTAAQQPLEPGLKDVKTAGYQGPRRLIVACDGTWVNSNSDAPSRQTTGLDHLPLVGKFFAPNNVTLPSNVTRLVRALNTNIVANQAVEPRPPQIVFYQAGIGTGGGISDKILGGATGFTISENIREAYTFICNNYQDGDEIFLFGFSRGAYTARAVSTLISDVGLLTMRGLEYFYQIFEDWKNQNVPEELKKQEEAERKAGGAKGAFMGLRQTPPMPSDEYRNYLHDVSAPAICAESIANTRTERIYSQGRSCQSLRRL